MTTTRHDVRSAAHWSTDIIAVSTIVLVSNAFLYWRALSMYDFFDMSAFMDAGYRVYIGQRPYIDFYYIAGPVHPYIHAMFYHLFGFGRWAVIAMLWSVNAIVISIGFAIARSHVRPLYASLIATAIAATFYVPIAHPWYDHHACLWLIGTLLLVEIQRRLPPVASQLAAVVCGILIALSVMTKHNIGVVGGLLILAVFAVGPRVRHNLTAYLVGGIVGSAVVLVPLGDLRPFIEQVFFQHNASARLSDHHRLIWIALHTPHLYLLLPLGLIVACGGSAFVRLHRQTIFLAAGLPILAFVATFTSSLIPYANTPMLGFAILYQCILLSKRPEPRVIWPPALRLTAVPIFAATVVYVVAHNPVPSAWRWKKSNLNANYALKTDAVKGWLCNAAIGEGVDAAVRVIEQTVPTDDSLLILPDATVIYGLTGRTSYAPAPFIYHLHFWPAPGPMADAFRGQLMEAPPKWILVREQEEVAFYNTQRILEWLGLKPLLEAHYTATYHRHGFWLFKRAQ